MDKVKELAHLMYLKHQDLIEKPLQNILEQLDQVAIDYLNKNQWQSIETAPRDKEFDGWGKIISDDGNIYYSEGCRHTNCYWSTRSSYHVARNCGKEGWCVRGDDGWSWGVVLTHWMPLPKGPEE